MAINFIPDDTAATDPNNPQPLTPVDFVPDDDFGVGFQPDEGDVERENIVIRSLGNIGNAAQRAYYQSRLATELQQEQPDANRVIELQQAMQQVPPSPEYMAAMNDELTPQESWNAFISNPVGVMGELLTESFVSFGEQMIDKAPATVAIGTAAGTAAGAPVAGVGAIPGAAVGARSGLAVASFSASRALEASDGILRSLEEAGVPMNDPQALSAALNDPERMKVAREFADKKAIPVGLFDAASMLLGGRLMGQKPLNALQKIGRGALETAIQSFLGMGGEATGQLAQDGEITSGRAIIAEGVGEIAPGAVEVAMGTRLQQAESRGMPEQQQSVDVEMPEKTMAVVAKTSGGIKVYRGQLDDLEGGRNLAEIQSVETLMGVKDSRPSSPFVYYTTDEADAKGYADRDIRILSEYEKRFGKQDAQKAFESLHGHKPRAGSIESFSIKPKKTLDLTGMGTMADQFAITEIVAKEKGVELPKNWKWSDVPESVSKELEEYGLLITSNDQPSWVYLRNRVNVTNAELNRRGLRQETKEDVAGNLFADWMKKHGYDSVAYMHETPSGPVKHVAVLDKKAKQTSTPVDRTGNIPTPTPLPDPPAAVKPRTFEQKAKEASVITPETREMIGSFYGAYNQKEAEKAANDWVDANGVDAAIERTRDFNRTKVAMSPIDAAIAQVAAARLGAMGQHERQAAIVMDLSEMGTAYGQTISIFSMLPRMTPEGITVYAQKKIARHIAELPEDRRQKIQQDIDALQGVRGQLGKMRTDLANKAISETPYGGETIKQRIARRIGDTAQSEQALVGLRDVMVKAENRDEAKVLVSDYLQEAGISESEAKSLSNQLNERFYGAMAAGRRELAASLAPQASAPKVMNDLLKKVGDRDMSDNEFIARLSQSKKIPALTPEVAAKLKEYARQYQEATDPEIQMVLGAKMYEEVMGLVPNDIFGKARAVSYLTMLFAPKTWIRNIGGNTVQFIANAGRDAAIGYVVDPLVSIVRGDNKRTSAGAGSLSRLKGLSAPLVDLKKGYEWNKKQNPEANFVENSRAALSHLRVLAKLTTQNKWELNDVKDVNRRMFSSKFMQMFESTLSVALGAPDRAFFVSQYRSSLEQLEKAAKQNGEWMGAPTPDMLEQAQAEAMYAIYQDPNRVSKVLGGIRRELNLHKEFGIGTAILPFTQVPGSIAKKGLVDWSPVGFIKAIAEAGKAGMFGKDFNQAKFNKDFTQAAVGSAGFYALGYWLANLGVITTIPEDDPDLEAMRRASGIGQYRINVTALNRARLTGDWRTKQEPQEGDTIVSYDWIQPAAITLAAGAEVYNQEQLARRKGLKDGVKSEAGQVATALMAGSKTLSEQQLLGGLGSFMSAYHYNKKDYVAAFYDTVLGIPSMFVPQLVRQAAQYRENTLRETRAGGMTQRAFSQVASQIPGGDEMFPPRFDIMGSAQERYQYGANSLANILLNPAAVTKFKADPVLQEITRVMDNTGRQDMIPRKVGKSIKINGKPYDLTNEQISAYQFYVGNLTMSMFQRKIASPKYARLPDNVKADVLARDLKDAHAATKSAVLGEDVRNLSRKQRAIRSLLMKSPLGQMPPTGMPFQSYAPAAQ